MEWFDCRARLRLFLLNIFLWISWGRWKANAEIVQTFSELHCSYVRNVRRKSSGAQVGIEGTYGQVCMCTYTRKSIRNPNCNTLRLDRPKHDRPFNCVIAQPYSSATFLVRFCSRKRKLGVCLKNVWKMFEKCYNLKFFTFFLACFNLRNLKLLNSRSVCTCTVAHSLSSKFLPRYHSEALRDVTQRLTPEERKSQPQCCGALKRHGNPLFLHLTLNWNGSSPFALATLFRVIPAG